MYRYAIHNAGVAVTLKKVHVSLVYTVELLLKDPLNKGRNKFDLSIKDKFCGPSLQYHDNTIYGGVYFTERKV